MSEYGSLLEQTREAFASASRLEAALMRNPASAALEINLISKRRLAERLEEQLFEVSKIERRDICRYRLVRVGNSGYELSSVARSLEKFQLLFSTIYDALSTQPKKISRLNSVVAAESSFDFGYSYAGSLGIVLTVPSERTLLSGRFDSSVEALGQIFEIENTYDVINIAHKLGNATIKAAYDWSLENYKSNYSVDINWRSVSGVLKGGIIPRDKMRYVVDVIDKTSDKEIDQNDIFGLLVGIDLKSRRFHFVVPDGDSYRGALGDDFPSGPIEVGKRYWAHIVTRRVLQYATQTETVTHSLEQLQPDLVT